MGIITNVINITRSNVIINGLEHYISGEGDNGAPYNGFITMSWAANIAIKNTIVTGHKAYGPIDNRMGSYDIQPVGVVNLLLSNVRQSNDIMAISRFGVFASNFCKNIVLDSCILSRFDAHQGVVNVTIANSELGYQGINVIGEGTLQVLNTSVYGYSFITLRKDYGSSWQGNFIIRNCTWNALKEGANVEPLIYAEHNSNHYYGYDCYIPTIIDIDGLYVRNATYVMPVNIFGDVTSNNNGPYPIHITERLRIKNYSQYSTAFYTKWHLSSNESLFSNVIIEED